MNIQSVRRAILEFIVDEDGAAAVEYAVMLSLIVGVCLASITMIANQTGESFDTTEVAISDAFLD